jgi:hypothetical protein
MGDIPPQLEFFWKYISGFENLISVILRHLEAELIILMCLNLIKGLFPPQIHFWQKPC